MGIAKLLLAPSPPPGALQRCKTLVEYDGGTRRVRVAHAKQPHDWPGEGLEGVVLDTPKDGGWLISFRVVWAEELRGRWVAVVRRGETSTLPDAMAQITDDATGELLPAPPAGNPMLERARHLGIALEVWERRVRHFDRRRGVTDDAYAALAAAAAALPDVGWVQAQLGMAMLGAGRSEDALAALERAARLDEAWGFHGERAQALLALGRPGEALLAVTDVQDARNLFARGRALRALDRPDEAIQALRAALECCRAEASTSAEAGVVEQLASIEEEKDVRFGARFALGEVLRDTKRFTDAIEVVADLRSEEAILLRAECFEALGSWREAKEQYALARDEWQSKRAQERLLDWNASAALQAPRPVASGQASFELGGVVEHAKFGRGQIIDVEEGRATIVVVDFGSKGEKRLPPSSLTRVEG